MSSANMSPENFCYWLQGFIEVENPMNIGENQTKIIKDHLQLVFKKETPKYHSVDLKLDNYKTNQGFNLNLNKDLFPSFNSNVSC